MKKILIVIPDLNHGGTNRALLNLLGVLDPGKFDMQIAAMHPEGPYKKLLSGYHLLPGSSMLRIFYSFSEAIAGESPWGILKITALKLYMKVFLGSDQQKIFKAAARAYSREHYDAVIAFQESLATQFASCIEADRRIAWVHCDYSQWSKGDPQRDLPFYERYHKIVTVSRYTGDVFRSCFPQMADRVVPIHNLMDQPAILRLSQEPLSDPQFCPAPFTLLSIGRMDPIKRFHEIPAMAAYLKQRGIPLRWYVIGGGSESYMETVRQKIAQEDAANEVILLGTRDNPYPYLLRASLLVCPSFSEAYPTVINEAKILGVPVVSADFPSAWELIDPDKNGVITPIERMASEIARLWEQPETFRAFRHALDGFVYDNDAITASVEKLFNGDLS